MSQHPLKELHAAPKEEMHAASLEGLHAAAVAANITLRGAAHMQGKRSEGLLTFLVHCLYPDV